jgi:hypothetical protein
MKRIALAALVALVTTSCSVLAPTPVGLQPVLGLSNGTPLAITLFVNGQLVGTAKPGVGLSPIAFANLPGLPWSVEARSPSGRVLTSMQVASDSVTTTSLPNGGAATSGTIGRVDLSCGRITIWAGYSAVGSSPSLSGRLARRLRAVTASRDIRDAER